MIISKIYNNASEEVKEELAEVCEMLAEYEKASKEDKKKFLNYADVFRKLGNTNSKLNKPKKEVIKMAKRITDAEKEERETRRILLKIQKLEKVHPQELVERACYRYKNANLEKRKAEKEALVILRERHFKEYEAIFKKRIEIINKQWENKNVRSKKIS